MNRIILIGNGFDLAHGLKTSYANFIDWYWKEWGKRLLHGHSKVEEDGLCSFKLNESINLHSWAYVWGWHYQRTNPLEPWDENVIVELAKSNKDLCDFVISSSLLEDLCKQIEERKWVDIENVYFRHLSNDLEKPEKVNAELAFIRKRLIDYLTEVQKSASDVGVKDDLRKKMLAPFNKRDVAISSKDMWVEMLEQRVNYLGKDWGQLIYAYLQGDNYHYMSSDVYNFLSDNSEKIRKEGIWKLEDNDIPEGFLLPDRILLLNFNYTNTADQYLPHVDRFRVNHIHGDLAKPESVVFGYGDEIDENYKKISDKNDNEYLKNIKSIKYLESPNYRNLLDFIESDTYQIFILGHSCGNSDRTLLNTLFEHKNCVSIKPFYYIRKDGTDNYMELVQNISRNFTDMKLMRDRVVNKTFCEPYSDAREKISYCADTPEGAKLPLP